MSKLATAEINDIRAKVVELREWESINNFSVVDLICEFKCCQEADIDSKGDIWIADSQAGHWLSEDDIRDFLSWLKEFPPEESWIKYITQLS